MHAPEHGLPDPSSVAVAGLPLSSHTWFRSDDRDESYRWLLKTMMPQRLWVESRQSTAGVVNRASLGDIHFNVLKFGRRVRIAFDAISDSHVLYLPLSGELVAVIDGERFSFRKGDGLIVSPDDPVELDFSGDAVGILIQIPRHRLERHLRSLGAGERANTLRFRPQLDLAVSGGMACAHMIDFLIDGLERGLWQIPALIGEMERALMSALLVAQKNSHSERLRGAAPRGVAKPYYVQRAERYMRDRLKDSLTLVDLVKASGVSERTLQAGFQRCYGTPPLRRLKILRLEQVHRALLDAEPGTARVTEIAVRFGLYQFGRFAADYKDMYGVLPSETLRLPE